MNAECTICLSFDPRLEWHVTACAHRFCKPCLEAWRDANGKACPLCRTPLDEPAAQAAAAPAAVVAAAAVSSSTIIPSVESNRSPPAMTISSSLVASTSVRSRLETEHEERRERRERRLALERRLDTYRSGMWTPSGRPYDTLPIVDAGGLRDVLRENKRALAGSLRSSAGWIGES